MGKLFSTSMYIVVINGILMVKLVTCILMFDVIMYLHCYESHYQRRPVEYYTCKLKNMVSRNNVYVDCTSATTVH